MIRVIGRYRNQKIELDGPLLIPEGTEVDLVIRPVEEVRDPEHDAWSIMGMSRLEAEWDNPQDAVYDDWRKLYGLDPSEVVLITF